MPDVELGSGKRRGFAPQELNIEYLNSYRTEMSKIKSISDQRKDATWSREAPRSH